MISKIVLIFLLSYPTQFIPLYKHINLIWFVNNTYDIGQGLWGLNQQTWGFNIGGQICISYFKFTFLTLLIAIKESMYKSIYKQLL